MDCGDQVDFYYNYHCLASIRSCRDFVVGDIIDINGDTWKMVNIAYQINDVVDDNDETHTNVRLKINVLVHEG